MKKRTKIVLVVIAVLSFALCAATLWFLSPWLSFMNSDISMESGSTTLEYNFADDVVLVVLTNEASLENLYYDYTPEDFAEIGCVEVIDLSSATTDHFRAQLKGELKVPENPRPGQAWFYQEKDVTTYNRILYLKLKDAGSLNVLNAIKILKNRTDIESAQPDYIYTYQIFE